jgi:two-component system, OmpR family, copper resistance phosphate regulon response regulator CusR
MKPSLMNILVVEDEPKVASFLKTGLEESGYTADIARDGMAGLNMFETGHYNLLILDVILPGKNGLELCREIRKTDQNIPVLMLTALGTTKDKISGFDSGADDYLVKPFEFSELLARIKSLLKRTSLTEDRIRILTFQDLELNLDIFEVSRSGKKIDLTQKEFALLEYLLKNRERVISRAEIAEKVWDITFNTGTNVIDVYINFLRKKIDRDFRPKLIHTQPGFGYILKTDPDEI